MFARRIVGGISGLTASTVRTGVSTAERIIGHGRDTASGAASTGTAVAGTVLRSTVGRFRPATTTAGGDQAGDRTGDQAGDQADHQAKGQEDDVSEQAEETTDQATTEQPERSDDVEAAEAAPRTVTAADLPLPNLPDEPPVDVVEQTLAAEESGEGLREGFATEPKGASRDETHGDAALQRAEVEELAEETVEATAQGSIDIETPVGTTGADVGFNPDTAEADLQQPGTEPLLDPSLTKEVIADRKIGAGDADVHKG